MRTFAITAAAATLLAFAAGPTFSAPHGSLHPSTRVICLDVGGETRPAVCRSNSSRLDQSDTICLCRNAQRVEAPVCAPGERPVGETRRFELARKDAARDGTLVGDTYQGRRMCVRPRNR